MRNLTFFIRQYSRQLVKKKWATLLLFLFPICMIGLLLVLLVGLLVPVENEAINIVLVDEDQTKESSLIVRLLEEMASDNDFIQISAMPLTDAKAQMESNAISAYFSLPEGFTVDLYEGSAVTIPVVGNPSKKVDSYLVNELIESMSRLIAAAQANLLTINAYAKEVEMSREEREEMLFYQFIDFTFFTLGKEQLLVEEVLENIATRSPKHYYLVAGWLTLFSVWLLAFYSVIGKEEQPGLLTRMRLLGVRLWQPILAQLFVALSSALLAAVATFLVIHSVVGFELYVLDYTRLALFTLLYGLSFLIGIALIDVWVTSRKILLLLQSLFLFLVVFLSGALIPTLYFPQMIQPFLPYLFSYETMSWLIDIVLKGRNYADFTYMAGYTAGGLFLLLFATIGKERWSR